MASIGTEPNGRRRVLFVSSDGRRKTLPESYRQSASASRKNNRLLTVEEVAGLTGLGVTTIDKLESEGSFPARAKLPGRLRRYTLASIERWMDRIDPNAEDDDA